MSDKFRASGTVPKVAAAALGKLLEAGLVFHTKDQTLGAVASAAFEATVEDLLGRMLSKREHGKVLTALTAARDDIGRRWTAGEDLREDGFFEASPDSSSFFAEIADGVIVAAQREHEQRKLQHLGYLISGIAYDSHVDRITAEWMLRTASDLTWTHYVLLALVGDPKQHGLPLHDIGARPTWASHSTWEAFSDLGERGRRLMEYDRSGEHSFPNSRDHPGKQIRTPAGQLLADKLRLETVSTLDLNRVATILSDVAPVTLP